jgi:hypothetical protein
LISAFKGYIFTVMQYKRPAPLNNAVANREAIAHIKSLYQRGRITRDVAEALASPIIARINKQQQSIALSRGIKNYPKTTFIGLMR